MTVNVKLRELARLSRETLWQNAFDGVLGQGAFSYNPENEQCAYRHEGDFGVVLKCGIGHSIPDAKYLPTMEGRCAGAVMVHNPLDLDDGSRLRARHNFLGKLQDIHDRAALRYMVRGVNLADTLNGFQENMIAFAKEEKLNVEWTNC